MNARIVQTMREETTARGARFLLVLLPCELDLGRLRRRRSYRSQWRAIAAALACNRASCIDLADDMLAAPAARLDRGFDGTHHGPQANQLVAAAIGRALEDW